VDTPPRLGPRYRARLRRGLRRSGTRLYVLPLRAGNRAYAACLHLPSSWCSPVACALPSAHRRNLGLAKNKRCWAFDLKGLWPTAGRPGMTPGDSTWLSGPCLRLCVSPCAAPRLHANLVARVTTGLVAPSPRLPWHADATATGHRLDRRAFGHI